MRYIYLKKILDDIDLESFDRKLTGEFTILFMILNWHVKG